MNCNNKVKRFTTKYDVLKHKMNILLERNVLPVQYTLLLGECQVLLERSTKLAIAA